MKIAVEGCAHGELDNIYDTIKSLEEAENVKVDLLLCCGDFQSTRNEADLRTMAVPPKYYNMCSFYKYYSGQKRAPFLTIFIGGNHEASNYLQELPYGGWVAPNIYYLGYAGVVNVNGLRIGGMSGIFKNKDYLRGRFEISPFDEDCKRSVYHTRNCDIFRLKQLSGKVDIFMSHDWPTNITQYGNEEQLLRFKPFFREDVESGKLGNPFAEELLLEIKPNYWFSGHLHCKFAALVEHENGDSTKFLSLDKCLPRRRFLQVVDVPTTSSSNDLTFEYDLEWLTILNLTNHLTSIKKTPNFMPGISSSGERYDYKPTDAEKDLILSKLSNNLTIPTNFAATVEAYNGSPNKGVTYQPNAVLNQQTVSLCKTLGIDDPIQLIMLSKGLDTSCDLLDTSADTSLTFKLDDISVSTPVKRTNSALELPAPINDSFSEEIIDAKPEIEGDDVTEVKLGSEVKDDAENNLTSQNDSIKTDSTLSESSTPNNKKFKRRNIDMYKEEQ